jgi:hypothetical protein
MRSAGIHKKSRYFLGSGMRWQEPGILELNNYDEMII